MRRNDAAGEAFALLRRRIGDHLGGMDQPQGLEGQELGVARPDADAPDPGAVGADHDFTAAHWVTGIIGRQPRCVPMGSALETEIRVSAPPSASRCRAMHASPSTVTTLATSLPPAGSAAQQRSTT